MGMRMSRGKYRKRLTLRKGDAYIPHMVRIPENVRDFFARMGRKGGKKGGKATAAKMTPEERSEAARRAVAARWAKTTPEERSAFAKRIRSGKAEKRPRKKGG